MDAPVTKRDRPRNIAAPARHSAVATAARAGAVQRQHRKGSVSRAGTSRRKRAAISQTDFREDRRAPAGRSRSPGRPGAEAECVIGEGYLLRLFAIQASRSISAPAPIGGGQLAVPCVVANRNQHIAFLVIRADAAAHRAVIMVRGQAMRRRFLPCASVPPISSTSRAPHVSGTIRIGSH